MFPFSFIYICRSLFFCGNRIPLEIEQQREHNKILLKRRLFMQGAEILRIDVCDEIGGILLFYHKIWWFKFEAALLCSCTHNQ